MEKNSPKSLPYHSHVKPLRRARPPPGPKSLTNPTMAATSQSNPIVSHLSCSNASPIPMWCCCTPLHLGGPANTSEVQNKMILMGHHISSCHAPVVGHFSSSGRFHYHLSIVDMITFQCINPGNWGLSGADKQGRYLLLQILHKIT